MTIIRWPNVLTIRFLGPRAIDGMINSFDNCVVWTMEGYSGLFYPRFLLDTKGSKVTWNSTFQMPGWECILCSFGSSLLISFSLSGSIIFIDGENDSDRIFMTSSSRWACSLKTTNVATRRCYFGSFDVDNVSLDPRSYVEAIEALSDEEEREWRKTPTLGWSYLLSFWDPPV